MSEDAPEKPKRQASPALLARAAARGPAKGAGHGGPAKGAGWGGDAQGASTSRIGPLGDEYSDAIRALARDPKHMAAKVPLRELALSALAEVAADEAHPSRVLGAEKLLARLDGAPKQPVENSGDQTVTFTWKRED